MNEPLDANQLRCYNQTNGGLQRKGTNSRYLGCFQQHMSAKYVGFSKLEGISKGVI